VAAPASEPPSDVPDVLAPGLRCVFCGINPGRVSAAARAHFANPRNDFWRLLHHAGFTPRRFEPDEQFALLELGYGVTNAAYRTTPGSGDLRRRDFDGARLERLAAELRPRAIAFVGKEAYRGTFRERPQLGPQERRLGETALYVLPSTSPANAAVPYAERLRWFRAFRASLP
jgi:TDG/mug DNA glycosylase family protein